MDLYREFKDAAERDDFDGMLSVYDRTWEETDLIQQEIQISMSRELMKRCPLPGRQMIGEAQFVRHFGIDPDQAGPDRILSACPLQPLETGNRFLDSPDCRTGECWHDNEEIIRWFYPFFPEFGKVSVSMKSCIWDKEEGKLTESVIPLELDGEYLKRIVAVSGLGDYLLAELRCLPGGEKSPDFFRLVCFTPHGRRVGVVLEGEYDRAPEGCFLEDGIYGPHRGYLWYPNTSRIWYFELDGTEFYTRPWTETRPREGGAFPMPEKLFYEENGPSYKRTGEIVKSVFLSVDGFGMALITSHTGLMRYPEDERPWEGRSLLFFRKDRKKWDRIDFGEPRILIPSKDLTFFIIGKRMSGSTDMAFRLYPIPMQRKQMPLFTIQCRPSDARIRAFSGDLNCLCDDRGHPLYALCWKFHKGKEGENKHGIP